MIRIVDSPSETPILIAEEVSRILEADATMRDRLNQTMSYLKKAIHVDACSILRNSQKTGNLHLESTDGLSPEGIGRPVLKKGEGLAAIVISTKKPLAVRDGPSHPNFRFIPDLELRERAFHSYLGVPILNGRRILGVLVVQTTTPRDFRREDIALLNTVSSQIGAAVAPIFRRWDRQAEGKKDDASSGEGARIVRGRSLAPGCFQGSPYPMGGGMRLDTIFTPPSRGVEIENKAIRKATRKVIGNLAREARSVSGTEGRALLIAQTVLLQDQELGREVQGRIEDGASAAEAIRITALRGVRMLESHADPRFAARAMDFHDIAGRVLRALGIESTQTPPGKEKIVGISKVVFPGDLLRMGPEKVGAIINTDQGIHSHTVILARSFGIPAVQLPAADLEELRHARQLLVDGTEGIVVIDPSPEISDRFRTRAEETISLPDGGPSDLSGPVRTPDGIEVRVGLNAGLFSDFEQIESYGPDDIGLYRTEIAFMSRDTMPSLKVQTAHYRKVLEMGRGRRLTFRTFDFGGDKVPLSLKFESEENPMMGNRSTRYMLEHEDLFRKQLKALLTVSASGPMSILLPMISTAEELNLVLDIINSIKNDLDRTGVEFDRDLPVGVMLEVPSVLFIMDALSRSAEFFCVGSNDLVQYLMAADRSNPHVSRLYQWHHPAVLAALDHLLKKCRSNGRPVTLCGEMAGNPWAAMLLVGMGYDHISVDSHSIPIIKWTLKQARGEMMKRLAEASIRASSSTEVIELFYGTLAELWRECAPLAKMLSSSLDRLRSDRLL